MTVLFAGGELDAFAFTGAVSTDTASTTRRDTDFARATMLPRNPSRIEVDFTSTTEAWLHVTLNFNARGASQQDAAPVRLIDSVTGQVVLQVDGDNGFWHLEYWNGASFTQLSDGLFFVAGETHRLDIHWDIANSGGVFEAYIDGTLISSFSGDTLLAGFTQIDRFQLLSSSATSSIGTYDVFYSEVIVATVETIGWRLSTLAPDGTGNSTTWTGDNTDVDDEGANDGTFVSSDTADEVEQFTVSDLSATASALDVEAVVVAARHRHGETGPQNLQLSVRTGTSDFFGSNISGVDVGFNPGVEIFDQNPDTVADWTTGEVDALEIGVKSIT